MAMTFTHGLKQIRSGDNCTLSPVGKFVPQQGLILQGDQRKCASDFCRVIMRRKGEWRMYVRSELIDRYRE
jgi:hypothetical protein